jgi:hypothetical protein
MQACAKPQQRDAVHAAPAKPHLPSLNLVFCMPAARESGINAGAQKDLDTAPDSRAACAAGNGLEDARLRDSRAGGSCDNCGAQPIAPPNPCWPEGRGALEGDPKHRKLIMQLKSEAGELQPVARDTCACVEAASVAEAESERCATRATATHSAPPAALVSTGSSGTGSSGGGSGSHGIEGSFGGGSGSGCKERMVPMGHKNSVVGNGASVLSEGKASAAAAGRRGVQLGEASAAPSPRLATAAAASDALPVLAATAAPPCTDAVAAVRCSARATAAVPEVLSIPAWRRCARASPRHSAGALLMRVPAALGAGGACTPPCTPMGGVEYHGVSQRQLALAMLSLTSEEGAAAATTSACTSAGGTSEAPTTPRHGAASQNFAAADPDTFETASNSLAPPPPPPQQQQQQQNAPQSPPWVVDFGEDTLSRRGPHLLAKPLPIGGSAAAEQVWRLSKEQEGRAGGASPVEGVERAPSTRRRGASVKGRSAELAAATAAALDGVAGARPVARSEGSLASTYSRAFQAGQSAAAQTPPSPQQSAAGGSGGAGCAEAAGGGGSKSDDDASRDGADWIGCRTTSISDTILTLLSRGSSTAGAGDSGCGGVGRVRHFSLAGSPLAGSPVAGSPLSPKSGGLCLLPA